MERGENPMLGCIVYLNQRPTGRYDILINYRTEDGECKSCFKMSDAELEAANKLMKTALRVDAPGTEMFLRFDTTTGHVSTCGVEERNVYSGSKEVDSSRIADAIRHVLAMYYDSQDATSVVVRTKKKAFLFEGEAMSRYSAESRRILDRILKEIK